MGYSVGDRVRWTSQASGFSAMKVGEVVAVLPAGTQSGDYNLGKERAEVIVWEDYNLSTLGYSTSRNHESYLVAVPGKAQPGMARPKLYWPRVSALQPADVTAESIVSECVRLEMENERLRADVCVLATAWQSEAVRVTVTPELHEAAYEAAARYLGQIPTKTEDPTAALIEVIESAWVQLTSQAVICHTLDTLRAQLEEVADNLAHAVRAYPHPEIEAWVSGKPWPPAEAACLSAEMTEEAMLRR